ncbi:hypothetical protein BV22DRAFT_1016396 [Leucogyrophana mollusca]|uniref:Uncharacterized protein n=1 Tax=Leucogyrophana mollusca TaxID=85980 RepID=A0ACB8BDW0_9AGAM|nr:hypothetical protein BV22DRAFT_1016396 [Leucogyrophana mollusca]
MRKTDLEIIELLKAKHIDLTKYGLGRMKFREMRESMGLLRTRQQGHSVDSISDAMQRLRPIYPNAGIREMASLLFHEEGMMVSRSVICSYFSCYEIELVRKRLANRLKRKRFWAAGTNDIVTVDQHDKWQRFGLRLHIGLDPFSGRIHWLKIYWTNKNPRLIFSYYLEHVETYGYMPLITQSDPGSENYGIANGHTTLRHWHDPSLHGTLQHRWMRQKKNVMPEIAWSQLRRRFTPGFENLLEIGIQEEWYDPDNYLHSLVFRWVFIPWLQGELSAYQDRVNNTRKRADRNKILPHGPPNHIHQEPEEYGVLDFKIKVDPNAIAHVRNLYAPPDHPVFDLVPRSFSRVAQECYSMMGTPLITRENVWDVYRDMLARVQHFEQLPATLEQEWQVHNTEGDPDNAAFNHIPLIAGLTELPNGEDVARSDGSIYLGGVNNGNGLG